MPGPRAPRSGSFLTRLLGRTVLRAAGWRFDGEAPDVPRFVVLVAPHTSNWDFIIGYAAKLAIGLRASWLGKHSLFRGPLGPLMRALGGIPVDRRATSGVVGQIVEQFRASPALALGIAPEGTRRRVDRWKTGFYHMAREAGVPIWPVALDWGARTVRLGPLFRPTTDEDADLESLLDFYRAVRGRHPDQAFPPPVA